MAHMYIFILSLNSRFFILLFNQPLQESATQVQEASKATLALDPCLIPVQLGLFNGSFLCRSETVVLAVTHSPGVVEFSPEN